MFVETEQGGGIVHEHVGVKNEETLALYFFAGHGHLLPVRGGSELADSVWIKKSFSPQRRKVRKVIAHYPSWRSSACAGNIHADHKIINDFLCVLCAFAVNKTCVSIPLWLNPCPGPWRRPGPHPHVPVPLPCAIPGATHLFHRSGRCCARCPSPSCHTCFSP